MTDAIKGILQEREKTHGDFSENALVMQTLKAAAHNSPNWAGNRLTVVQREAIDMIMHKAGRILAGNPNHLDHWQDIAGYAQLVADRIKTDSD